MSRPLATLALALSLWAGSVDIASAKRGFGGVSIHTTEVLRDLRALDDETSLCHLIEFKSLFGKLGLWAQSKGYVLGAPGCTGESYRTLLLPVSEAKAEGLLPADLPDQPALTPKDYLDGFGAWGLLAALIGILGLSRALSGRKRKIRQGILTLEDGPAFRLIDVMCHAAIADGRVDPAEVAYIRDVARETTGLDYSEAHIRETISRADRLSKPQHLAPFAKGLTLSQRHLILQAALSVVAADGEMAKKESQFIGLLVAGFGLARDDLDQALRIIATRRAGAAPA